jgi:hypothetical protein
MLSIYDRSSSCFAILFIYLPSKRICFFIKVSAYPLEFQIAELGLIVSGLKEVGQVDSAYGLPMAIHLLRYQFGVGVDYDLFIGQIVVNQTLERTYYSIVFRDLIGHTFALSYHSTTHEDEFSVFLSDNHSIGGNPSIPIRFAQSIYMTDYQDTTIQLGKRGTLLMYFMIEGSRTT